MWRNVVIIADSKQFFFAYLPHFALLLAGKYYTCPYIRNAGRLIQMPKSDLSAAVGENWGEASSPCYITGTAKSPVL